MKKKTVDAIARRYGLRAVILFGSKARGTAKPESDCDICVSSTRIRGDELRLIGDLCEALHEDVDLCVFERIGPSLRRTVAQDGTLLHGSRDLFHRLRLQAFKEWQDSRKFVDATRSYLKHRGL